MLCVFFNLVNVLMEEGVFRGLLPALAGTSHRWRAALLFQSVLFGVWHIVTPLRALVDGQLEPVGFLALSVGYLILSGLMGVKWGLLCRMTGNLYAGMADHFFNNCVATNLLHVVTEGGADEWMILRVSVAQLLSFALVLLAFLRRGGRGEQADKGASQ